MMSFELLDKEVGAFTRYLKQVLEGISTRGQLSAPPGINELHRTLVSVV